MRKCDELKDQDSCMSRAHYEEMTFVLLSRDLCTPDTIRYWAGQRVVRGKNKPGDPQILEALECARIMEEEREQHKS